MRLIAAAIVLALLTAPASAGLEVHEFGMVTEATGTPLTLDYSVTDIGGGLYDYEFTLTLDNNDGSWFAGQSFDWIIWGDAPGMPSPLTDFVGDVGDLPVGPFNGYTSSGGGHNGPTFLDLVTGWVPGSIGEFLFWSGTSTANLGQGELLWSNLVGTGKNANFVVGNLVPTPGAAVLLAFGLVGARRRRAG